MKGTGPCNFSTIVPFWGHDFCVIDSILYHSDQPGWSLSLGDPPAGFLASVTGHRGVRRQLRSVIVFSEFGCGMSKNFYLESLYMLFYPAPLHRIQEDVANCLSNSSKACAGLLKKLSRPELSASSLSELSTGHPLVPRSSRFFNRISKVSLNPHDRWASYASDKRSQKDNTQIGKWLESVLPSKTAARLRDWGLDASFREFDKGCFTVSQ